MPELSLNSFFGMQSTKEPPAAGLLKTGNSSLQGNKSNNGENSFLAKLAHSMNNESTTEDQNSTLIPSELINILSNEEINYLIDLASMGTSTNIATNVSNDQMPLYQFLNHNIPVEAFNGITTNNSTNNGKAAPVQTQASTLPGHALPVNQGSIALSEPNIDPTKIAQGTTRGSNPEPPSASIIDKLNTGQVNSKTNEQNVTDILNKLIPAKTAGTTGEEPTSQSSTAPGKQIVESHKGPGTNSLNIQLDTNKNSNQEQTPAPSENNINTKANKQNETGTLSKLNPTKIADKTEEESISQSTKTTGKIPGKQIAESHKGYDINHDNQNNRNNQNIAKVNKLNTAGILNKLNPTKVGATAAGEPPSQAPTIPGTQVAESHKGANTNSNNQNNTNTNNQNRANSTDKLDNAAPAIEKTGSEQALQASKTSDSGTDPMFQSNPKPAQTKTNESQKIFDIRPDSAGAIVSKSSDSTTTPIINSSANNVNVDEVLLPLNTSSENSSLNHQGKDAPNESYINAVTTGQKVKPGKDFTSTLSQINNSAKPLESLGSGTADNIVQKAKMFLEGGKSEIKIQLNPPELGILKLEFEVDNDSLETKITVERSAVKDVIDKDVPRLRDLLSNADVDVGKLDVSLQEKEDEKLGLMKKDTKSDSESDSAKDIQDKDNESIEDSIEEESMEYDKDSNKINLLA